MGRKVKDRWIFVGGGGGFVGAPKPARGRGIVYLTSRRYAEAKGLEEARGVDVEFSVRYSWRIHCMGMCATRERHY